MAYSHHSRFMPDPENRAARNALADVLATLLEAAGPKREAKARRELERFATRLETYQGRHLPGPNVVPIRGAFFDEEALRRERAEQAAYVRALLERFFA